MFSVTQTSICETRQTYIKEYSINFGNIAPVHWYYWVKHYLLVTVRVALSSICHLEVPEGNACSSSFQHTLLVLRGQTHIWAAAASRILDEAPPVPCRFALGFRQTCLLIISGWHLTYMNSLSLLHTWFWTDGFSSHKMQVNWSRTELSVADLYWEKTASITTAPPCLQPISISPLGPERW